MKPKAHSTGSLSIEFSLSFIILIILFYGIAGYAMPLLLSASYQQVASDALREGIAWQRHRYATDAEVQTYVDELIAASWIPNEWAQRCEGETKFLNIDSEGGLWEVCLRHSAPNTILPPIRMMGWEFPQLPDQIMGFATMHTRECNFVTDETCSQISSAP